MKNMISKRLPALLLAVIMLLSLGLSACSRREDTQATDPTGPEEGQVTYTIVVKGVGGMLQPDVTVTLVDDQGNTVATGVTDENGSFVTYQDPAEYTVKVEGLREGYTASDVKTTTAGGTVYVVADTSLILDNNHPSDYYVGSVMHDFTFLDNDDNQVTLAQLLETKKLVLINFWASWCPNCKAEFPGLQAAYENYSDDVAVVCLNTSDTKAYCEQYREENGYTFTMTTDENNLYYHFMTAIEAEIITLPCTIMVDRYGVINEIEKGAITAESDWAEAFEYYISDDYVQKGSADGAGDYDAEEEIKPDVDMPDSSQIEAAVNGEGFTTTYTGPKSDTIWPWVLKKLEDGNTVLEPSNYGIHSTTALINLTVELKAGDVLAFDYKYSIEYDEWGTDVYDRFVVAIDGDAIQTMVTPQNGWVTCYAYTPADTESGTYTVTLYYNKDASDGYGFMEDGQEYLYVDNIRVVSVADMTAAGGSMNVWRAAATGVAEEGSATYFENYVDVVMGDDGYYHVGTKDGPLLLASLTGSTRWSDTSLQDLGINGYLKINGVDYSGMPSSDPNRSYWWLESNSDLGYSVVDAKLAYMLQLFAKNVGSSTYANGWLEMCCYFEHYGVGEGITTIHDVRKGLDMDSAVEATLGTNHAYINRSVVPRGYYYAFTPTQSGVYTFHSVQDGAYTNAGVGADTIAWLYDSDGNLMYTSEDEASVNGEVTNYNFRIYARLEAGKTYYIAVGMDPVDYLGEFDFLIEYLGTDTLDVKSACAENFWTTTEDYTAYIIVRKYDFQAGLGKDGYYHQILSDGTLDYSETGYVYLDFNAAISFISYAGSYPTMEDLITNGYYTYVQDENDEDTYYAALKKGTFDFADREDIEEEWREKLGNHQTQMEEYLKQAKANGGYLAVDEELCHILTDLMDLYGFSGVEDQWLMLCYFMRHI